VALLALDCVAPRPPIAGVTTCVCTTVTAVMMCVSTVGLTGNVQSQLSGLPAGRQPQQLACQKDTLFFYLISAMQTGTTAKVMENVVPHFARREGTDREYARSTLESNVLQEGKVVHKGMSAAQEGAESMIMVCSSVYQLS